MSDILSIRFFYSWALCVTIRYCNRQAESRNLPDQSSIPAFPPFAWHSPHITMITIETEYFNPISQDFYDNTIHSIDLALLPCTCGHLGCLIWYGSYSRNLRQGNSNLLLRVARVLCKSCGHSHALLLSPLVPYSQIPLPVQVSIVRSYEDGSCRNTAVPQERGCRLLLI